jgi:hypothetical protein
LREFSPWRDATEAFRTRTDAQAELDADFRILGGSRKAKSAPSSPSRDTGIIILIKLSAWRTGLGLSLFFSLMNAFERGGLDMSTGSSKAAGFEEFYLRTSL